MQHRRRLYPKNWRDLAYECKKNAKWKCEVCHAKQNEERYSRRTGAMYEMKLVAAHLDMHDEANPAPRLMCMCPSCHAIYDIELRIIEAKIKHECKLHEILLEKRAKILRKIGRVQRYRKAAAA